MSSEPKLVRPVGEALWVRVRAPLATLRVYRDELAQLAAQNTVGQEALVYAIALLDRDIKLEERCKSCFGTGQYADMYDEWDCSACKGTGKIPC